MHDELVCEFTPDQLEEGERVMNECMLEAQDFVQDSLVPSQLETFQGRDWSSK
jgi:DNA polymerase I-like protein with 3'-5' exonuclease and polymerase domains